MSRIKEFLNNIINKRNMCALCLKEVDEDCVYILDETVLKINNTKTILELVSFILGEEVCEKSVSTIYRSIIRQCVLDI